jgi:FkbM family methyltransferase
MALLTPRRLLEGSAKRLGYRVERDVLGDLPRVDVFDIMLRRVAQFRGEDFFFIQVGANDGITVDPIREYILEHHWKGILVEPQAKVFGVLRENYRDEPQLIFENSALAERDGTMTLYVLDESIDYPAASGWVSFNKEHVRRWVDRSVPVDEIQVPAVSAATLLARHGVGSVDLLQVDTEGYDARIVGMFLDAGVLPSIIRFEYPLLSPQELRDCLASLSERGYRLHREGVDIIAFIDPDRR